MLEYADDNNPTGKSLKILIHHDDLYESSRMTKVQKKYWKNLRNITGI